MNESPLKKDWFLKRNCLQPAFFSEYLSFGGTNKWLLGVPGEYIEKNNQKTSRLRSNSLWGSPAPDSVRIHCGARRHKFLHIMKSEQGQQNQQVSFELLLGGFNPIETMLVVSC